MKVIIAGGRDYIDYKQLCSVCDYYLQNISPNDIEIVSGRARGVDQLGERYANERGYKIKYFPAEWSRYNKSAGYIRNSEMAEYADALIGFWDGKSKGTKNMIDLATKKNLLIRVFRYD